MPVTDDWDLEGLRRRSELLFGSPHRLPVAVLTAEAKRHELFAKAIAELAGIERKDAVRLLGDWRAADLLDVDETAPGPRPRGGQPNYLRRRDDKFWECMQALGEKYRRRPPGGAVATSAPAAPGPTGAGGRADG